MLLTTHQQPPSNTLATTQNTLGMTQPHLNNHPEQLENAFLD